MIASGIKRGTAELAVLSILQAGALHGYEIARRIEQETNGSLRFTLAALYPMLYRLEKQKWIGADWKISENKQEVKVYRLTAAGRKRLTQERSRWEQISEAIGGVLNPAKKERAS